MTQTPDTLILSDNVITAGRDKFAGPAGVLVADGVVTAVLPPADAIATAGPATRVIDYGHRTVMPGFVDPHAHAEVAARTRYLTVDCRAPEHGTIPDVQEKLRDSLDQARDGWLVGQSNLFFDQKLRERRLPNRDELDAVSTSVAIALRCGGHITVLNTRAMELAGISESYEEVAHSITGKPTVVRDTDGRPTGVVKEMDNLLPLPTLDDGELEIALAEGLVDLFTRYGVTTLGEIGESREGLAAFDRILAAGGAIPRTLVYLWVPGMVSLDEACEHRDWARFTSSSDLLKVHGVKMFSDGGYSAKSAAMTRPYVDEHGHCGHVAMTEEQLVDALRRTAESGLQLAVHANGDLAQQVVCAAFEKARPALVPGAPRPRVEHAGNFLPDYEQTTAAWHRAGILPAPQPVFIYNFGEFVPIYLGDYARSGQFPFRRLIDDGWPISGSSDVWIGSEQGQTNPLFSIACAVGRASFHGYAIEPEQSVTTYEAIQMHTVNAAATLGLENDRGSLEPGKKADLIVLAADPLATTAERLTDIRVDEVWRDGDVIFTHTDAPAPAAR